MTDVAIPMGETGFGGMGAGLGGLIGGLVLGSIWSGNGWGGWGGNGRAGQVGADVALANGIQNLQNTVSQSAVDQAQGVGQLGLSVANAAAGVTAGVTQNTIANLQGFAGVGNQICCGVGRLSQEIDQTGDQTIAAINQANIQGMQNTQIMADRVNGVAQNVINRGYEAQLQAQQLNALLQAQHADLKATIIDQGCQDRALQRQIQTEAITAKLTEAQAKIVQLETQNYVNQSNSQQTLYLMSQLKPAGTTTAAAGA